MVETQRESRIVDIEHKVSKPKDGKSGMPYIRAKLDDNQWYSCFEDDVAQDLIKFKGGICILTLSDRGNGFVNITSCGESSGMKGIDANQQTQAPPITPMIQQGNPSVSNGKNATMYTSYAKDIFIKLLEVQKTTTLENNELFDILMDKSLELVDKAREYFQ